MALILKAWYPTGSCLLPFLYFLKPLFVIFIALTDQNAPRCDKTGYFPKQADAKSIIIIRNKRRTNHLSETNFLDEGKFVCADSPILAFAF